MKKKKINKIFDLGAEITGSVTGAALGLVFAGPPGAIAGAVVSPAITKLFKYIGEEVENKLLSPREKVRIGACLRYIYEKYEENKKDQKELNKEFFKTQGSFLSPIEQLFEATILNVQREYEEKKIKYQSFLYANLLTDKNIDKDFAIYYINLAKELSYGQYCLLKIFSNTTTPFKTNVVFKEGKDFIRIDTLNEIYGLFDKGLLKSLPNNSFERRAKQLPPENIMITGNGIRFYELMSLSEITPNEIDEINSRLMISKKEWKQ